MSSTADSVRQRIARKDSFGREEIEAFMRVSDDLDLWSATYEALGRCHEDIQTEIGTEAICSFMLRYLLRCIQENPQSGDIHSRYEAAWELSGCLKLWSSSLPDSDAIMRLAEREIAGTFRAGDEGVRNCLLCGTLEHALEAVQVRPYFADWAHDPIFRETWKLAMRWALSHSELPNKSNWP